MESETVETLIEAIENLDDASARISAVLSWHNRNSSAYSSLLRARSRVNDTAGLVRSILDKGR